MSTLKEQLQESQLTFEERLVDFWSFSELKGMKLPRVVLLACLVILK